MILSRGCNGEAGFLGEMDKKGYELCFFSIFLSVDEWPFGSAFEAKRGLRQGYPLSPFLFILCAEGLSAMISIAVPTSEIEGLRVAQGSLTISHLLFANDSLLFAKANRGATVV